MKKILVATFVILIVFMYSCNNKGKNNSDTNNIAMEIVSEENSMYLLVGTYTAGESDGIYIYQFDTVSGYSQYKGMAKVDNPSYLVVSKDEKFVYAVTETGDNTAAANAFSFDKKEGKLTFLNNQPTNGDDPCFITIDDVGSHVVTANYSGGSITVFDVKADGRLNPAMQQLDFHGKGVDAERQEKPHLHCIAYSPDGKFLFANDLGTDQIYKFNVKAGGDSGDYLQKGSPSSFKVAAGSGPRHLAFHPDGKYMYLINELSGAVIVFSYHTEDGNLTEIQAIQADTLHVKGSADIHVSPDGKFLYTSNRLQGDGLAIFSIDQANGKLTKVGYQETGIHPRNFVITPNGKYLLVASRDNDIIQIFERDMTTGLLNNVYKDIELDMPVCLKFVSFGKE